MRLPDFLLPSLPPEALAQLREIELRDSAQRHIAPFARYVVEVEPATHHQLFCRAFEELTTEDLYDDLIINTPPGSAKSTYASHVFPSWFLGSFSSHNVILASHTAALAEKWSRRIRNTFQSSAFANVFPDASLSPDSTAVARWTTSSGGECVAAGVGASILGFRADLVVIDDPLSGWEQASSETQLQKVHDWFRSDLKSRLKPGAKIVLICQRLAANDLAGLMIQEHAENPTRRLRVINLPMVADSPDDPLGRQIGDILWPEWYTPEMVADLRKDDLTWRTMWQQQPPSSSGDWISAEDILTRPSPPADQPRHTYGMTDLALSVNGGDYTVHFVVGIDQYGDWDILDAVRERVDPDTTSSRIVALSTTYSPQEWLIDDDNMAKVLMPLVATLARQTNAFVPWKMMPMRGQDKETRAAPLRGMFKRRKIYMPPDAPFRGWLTKELLTFPNAIGQGVDDGIDSLGLLGRRLLAIAKPAAPAAPPPPPPTTSNMTLDGLWEERARSQSLSRRRL
jgi:predicted phage terminase large subunit-like protein